MSSCDPTSANLSVSRPGGKQDRQIKAQQCPVPSLLARLFLSSTPANNAVKQAIIGDSTSIVYCSDAGGNESGAETPERFMELPVPNG
jgi:hypothetical protein